MEKGGSLVKRWLRVLPTKGSDGICFSLGGERPVMGHDLGVGGGGVVVSVVVMVLLRYRNCDDAVVLIQRDRGLVRSINDMLFRF